MIWWLVAFAMIQQTIWLLGQTQLTPKELWTSQPLGDAEGPSALAGDGERRALRLAAFARTPQTTWLPRQTLLQTHRKMRR